MHIFDHMHFLRLPHLLRSDGDPTFATFLHPAVGSGGLCPSLAAAIADVPSVVCLPSDGEKPPSESTDGIIFWSSPISPPSSSSSSSLSSLRWPSASLLPPFFLSFLSL